MSLHKYLTFILHFIWSECKGFSTGVQWVSWKIRCHIIFWIYRNPLLVFFSASPSFLFTSYLASFFFTTFSFSTSFYSKSPWNNSWQLSSKYNCCADTHDLHSSVDMVGGGAVPWFGKKMYNESKAIVINYVYLDTCNLFSDMHPETKDVMPRIYIGREHIGHSRFNLLSLILVCCCTCSIWPWHLICISRLNLP